MKKILFLDLEGTIIDTWANPVLINISQITAFIEHGNFDELSIFSFAIWHEKDRAQFFMEMLKPIEGALGRQLNANWIPTTETLRRDVMREFNLSVCSHDDFFSFQNKESAFITFCRRNFDNCHCFLLDDIIWDEINFAIPKKNLTVSTINVHSLR